jgi:hypothetical protein
LVKNGPARLPLDRVPALATALDVDPARLLQLALAQWAGSGAARAFDSIFETVVTKNEIGWLNEIRDASGHTDPCPLFHPRHFWEVARCTIFFSAAGDGLAKP